MLYYVTISLGDVMQSFEKELNRFYNNGYTFFLNKSECNTLTTRLKKNTFNIYKPNNYSEKVIVYQDTIPEVILLEIIIKDHIRHQDILGSLMNLGIDDGLFGDIIIYNNHYYFYTFKKMLDYFKLEFTKIKRSYITLLEQDLDYLKDYEPEYIDIKVITSSLRIDNVIAKIIHKPRNEVKKNIKDKMVIYNDELLTDSDKLLKVDDTFSIRKIGKFKFDQVISNTKKDNIIINVKKYC